ncbi:MAG: tetratricopeptide repeat protein [Armatimonadaceae bacterium]
MSQNTSADLRVTVSPAADALDFASLQSLPSVGDRLRSLEQIARSASLVGYTPLLGEFLQDTARLDHDHAVARLAREILGSLVRWDWWPAQQVAPAMAQIERSEAPEDIRPLARSLTELVPDYFHGWALLATASSDIGDHWDARRAVEQALALRPGHVPIRLLSSYIEATLGNLDQARAMVDQLLVDVPDNPEVRFHSGWVYERLGDFESALADYLIVAQADDQEPHWVAVQQAALRVDRWDLVLEADRALVRLNPESPLAHHQCAVACEENALFDEAAWHLAEAHLHGAPITWSPGRDVNGPVFSDRHA